MPEQHGSAAAEMAMAKKNDRIELYLVYAWVAVIAVAFTYRVVLATTLYLRKISCLGSAKQLYFKYPHATFAAVKRYLLDAPLLRKRHREPFMPSTSISFGSPPSRVQSVAIIGYIAMNVGLVTTEIDYSGGTAAVAGQLLHRSGRLSVLNMIPLFVLAGRNNPLIKLLDIQFNTFNLLHRWIGRVVVALVLVHGFAWLAASMQAPDATTTIKYSVQNVPLITTGVIAGVLMVAVLLLSNAVLRRASYEVFLHVHILLIVGTLVTLYLHLKTLPAQRTVLGLVGIWAAERLVRVYRIVRHNVGRGGTRAEVECMAGDAMRVTLHMARPWKFTPGQFVFLYMPAVGMWTSHPFSLAWSEDGQRALNEKGLPMTTYDDAIVPTSKTTMSLIIRRRNGFTNKLWHKAARAHSGTYVTSAIVEGPYGGHNLDSYGTVMLFAAGVGITHQMPYVRHLVNGFAQGTSATRRVTLVWILQSPEHLDWIRPWMEPILAMDKRREVLKILLFITRPRSTKEIRSPSETVQMFPGKPNVDILIAKEQLVQQGAMAVSVCGTGSLSDDVRDSVRKRADKTNVDLVDYLFSW